MHKIAGAMSALLLFSCSSQEHSKIVNNTTAKGHESQNPESEKTQDVKTFLPPALVSSENVSRCQLIAQDCPKQGNTAAPFAYDDLAWGASTDLTRCLARAEEFKVHCGTKRQIMVRAYSPQGVEVGRRVLKADAGIANLTFTECQLSAQDCPNQGNQNRPFTYTDKVDGADSNLNRCLARADDLKLHCNTINAVSASAVDKQGRVVAKHTIPTDVSSRVQNQSTGVNVPWAVRWGTYNTLPRVSSTDAMTYARSYISDAELLDLKTRGFKSIRVSFDMQYLFRPVFPGSGSSAVYDPQNPYLPVIWTIANRILAAGLNVSLAAVVGDFCFQALLENDSQQMTELCAEGPALSDYDRKAKAYILANSTSRSALMTQYIDFWRSFSKYLDATMEPSRVLIEPLNEPVYLSNPDQWTRDQEALFTSIRKNAKRLTLVATSTSWSDPKKLLNLAVLGDKNIAYNFHFYINCFTHATAPWDKTMKDVPVLPYPVNALNSSEWDSLVGKISNPRARSCAEGFRRENWGLAKIQSTFAPIAAWAHKNGLVLMANEFGTLETITQTYRNNWARDVRTVLQSHGIAWSVWAYKERFGIYDGPEAAPVAVPAMLKALGL